MRLRHRQPDAGIAKINVTPLIDVIMVLIIFYLIVGKLAQDRATQVQLPVTPVGTSASNVGVVLAAQLDEGGGMLLSIDGVRVPLDELERTLRARFPELAEPGATQTTPLSLRGDRRLTYAQLAPIFDACKRAGITNVQMIAGKEAN